MMKTAYLVAFTANVLFIGTIASSVSSSPSETNNHDDGDNTKCNKPNEEYDICPAPCPPRRCDVEDSLILCEVPPQPGDPECEPGCRCSDNYARNDKGICIPREQCPKNENQCNKPNEEYQQCPDCSPGTCESIGKIYHCPLEPSDTSKCKGACRCKLGYYRNIIGECITEDQCLQCNGPHEYFSCGPECDNVCATLDTQNKTNCPIINIQCNKKCYCEDGYARDESNICIPINQCKTGGCKENERYVECPDAECVAKTCADVGFPVSCPRIAAGRCPSKPGCICNSGYYRNSKGICVPGDQCPSCGGDTNARPGCGVNCGRLCSNYDNPDGVACPLICNLNGCDCIDGYVLDTNTGKCVLPKECTPQCGKDEIYSTCVNGGCDKRLCSQLDQPQICIDPIKCEGGCVCREGYLRDSNGVCVPEDQCGNTPKCSVNEVLSNCIEGVCRIQDCSQKGQEIACIAVVPPVCTKGCICAQNYLRNSNGTCVPEDDCDEPTCSINEELSNCIEGVCRIQDCSQKGQEISCAAVVPPVCTKGCLCAKNYLRNANGTCVPDDQCEECPEGETYSNCPPVYRKDCDSEYCPRSRNDPATCPTTRQCGKPKCVCGYLDKRNRETGKCVRTSDCPPFPCDGPNEEYQSCPPGCPGEDCSDYLENTQCPKFKIGIVVPCEPQCRCLKGYYRNSEGICVDSSKCTGNNPPCAVE